MKILVICQYYYPEPFRISDICESLVRDGHEVTVVTGTPNYPDGFSYEGYGHGNRIDETINGVKVHRCPIIERRKGVLFRFLNYYSYSIQSKRYVRKTFGKNCQEKFDAVLVNQLSPIMMANAGILYKKMQGVPVLLYCLDLWPESLVAGGIKRNSILYRLYHRVSAKIYRAVDKILVTSSEFTNYICDEFAIDKVKVSYLPQYAESAFEATASKQDNGVIDLMFAGNIGDIQSVDTIVEAARILNEQNKHNIVWHIVGSGSDLDRISGMVSEHKLDNVILHGRMSMSEMPQMYAKADAMLVTLRGDKNISMTLPGKVQSYLAASKSIIGAINGEAARVIREADCGYVGPAEDARALAENVIRFCDDPDRARFGRNGYEYYQKNFSKEKFISSIEDALERLVRREPLEKGRITLVNVVCGIGSTGRICTDLARKYEDDGYVVRIVYGRGRIKREDRRYAIKVGTWFDSIMHGMLTRLFDMHGLGSSWATKRVIAKLDAFDPDILWLHNIHGYYINYELLFKWIKAKKDLKVKWTLHDCWSFTGHCSHFMSIDCEKWISDGRGCGENCGGCALTGEYPKSIFKDNSKNNYVRKRNAFSGVKDLEIIVPSVWLGDQVHRSFLNAYPIEVRKNVINREVFKRTPSNFRKIHGLENRKIVLGVASAWSEKKGLKDYIKLYKLVEQTAPEIAIVLVGSGLKESRLPSNIICIDRTESPQKLAEIYTAADVFFNPTHEDNFPTVNLEAEACGTPVVTYDTGGSKETIQRADSIVVRERTVRSGYEAICRLLYDDRADEIVSKLKTKILMINVVCGIKSTGRICFDVAQELDKRDVEVKIAYARGHVPEAAAKYAVKIGNGLDIGIHGINARLFDRCGFGSKHATRELIKWIDEFDPDVIHLHNLHGYYINVDILFRYLKRYGKRVIWTLHDCWAFTGHCAYFDHAACEKWKTGCKDCPNIREYPTSLAVDRSRKNYILKKDLFTGIAGMTLVTPSEWLSDLVSKSFLRNYKVKVINNGINTEVFRPTESELREKYALQNVKVVLGVNAVWDRRKGLDTFVELSKVLPKDMKIVLVGTARDRSGIPDNIICIDKTDSTKELAAIYSMADIFVNPTMEDNYPTTNLEAIACGTPVISYNSGGSGESATIYGAVIPRGDFEALHQELISNRSYDRAEKDLSVSAMVEEYCRLYEV